MLACTRSLIFVWRIRTSADSQWWDRASFATWRRRWGWGRTRRADIDLASGHLEPHLRKVGRILFLLQMRSDKKKRCRQRKGKYFARYKKIISPNFFFGKKRRNFDWKYWSLFKKTVLHSGFIPLGLDCWEVIISVVIKNNCDNSW